MFLNPKSLFPLVHKSKTSDTWCLRSYYERLENLDSGASPCGNPLPTSTSSVTLGTSLPLSEPQFPHLQKADNNNLT